MRPILIFLIFTPFTILAQTEIYPRTVSQDFNVQVLDVEFGDLNGDDQVDMIVSYMDKNFILILENIAPNGFGPPELVYFESGSRILEIELADVNNDGLKDIIIGDYDNSRIGVFKNLGNLTFAEVSYFDVQGKPQALVSSDFNGDLLEDIAVACDISNTVSVLFGDINDLLAFSSTYDVGSNPVDIKTGNVDADGNLDLLIANKGSSSISLMSGSSTGIFNNSSEISLATTPEHIQVDDIDGDTNLDFAVVFTESNRSEIHYGNGNGTFDAPVVNLLPGNVIHGDFVIEDLNIDGKIDVAILSRTSFEMHILSGNGDKTFQIETHGINNIGLPNLEGIYLTDLNGQGEVKLSIASLGSTKVTENILNPNAFSVKGYFEYFTWARTSSFDVGDVNGDNITDLVVANSQRNFVTVLLGGIDERFDLPKFYYSSYWPSKVKLLDLDNDLDLDMMVIGFGAEVFLNLNGEFIASQKLPSSSSNSFAFADYNGDDYLDIYASERFYINNGDGSFTESAFFGFNVYTATNLDFNNDGNQDLAIGYINDEIKIYPGNGDGTFAAEILLNHKVYDLTNKDLNNDGLEDLIGFDILNDNLFVIMATASDPYFGDPFEMTISDYATFFKVFDVDKDDKIDFIAKDIGGLQYYTLESAEPFTISGPKFLELPLTPTDIASTDFDQDGFMDLFLMTTNYINILTDKELAQVFIQNMVQQYSGNQIFGEATTEPAGLMVNITYNGNITGPVIVGNYSIVATIDDSFYRGEAAAILEITQKDLTFIAENKTVYFELPLPELTYQIEGFVGTDDLNDLDELPTITTTANNESELGEYPITMQDGIDNNYAYTFVDGVLTITDVLAIGEDSTNAFSTYPNPVTDRLIIQSNQLSINGVRISDLSGKAMYYVRNTADFKNSMELSINGLKNGIYVLHIFGQNEIITKRIQVSR